MFSVRTMRKVIVISGILIVVIILFLSSLTLVKQHDRAITYRLSKSTIQQVKKETKGMDEKKIIDYSLNLTCEMLEFGRNNEISNGKANCIGYAQLCSAICNEALRNNGYRYRAKPVVGYIKSFGLNLCSIAKSLMTNQKYKAFVKDHDFVELGFKGKTYYFDPSIYDVLGNKCLTVK